MSKTYSYDNLVFPAGDNDEVSLTVKYISDGNLSETSIRISGMPNLKISDEGTVLLGIGKNLRQIIDVATALENLLAAEDTIALKYFLNDTEIQRHVNAKTECEDPTIILSIKVILK